MAGLKLTTIWFLLLWQFFLPRKVLEENSSTANGFGGKENEILGDLKLFPIPAPMWSFGSDAPAIWVQFHPLRICLLVLG